jgi:cell division protein ZapB
MNMQTIIEQLNEKIDAMVARYETMKNENSALQNEVASVKAQSEAKDTQIRKLEDENALKDIEIEEIVKKIESALG